MSATTKDAREIENILAESFQDKDVFIMYISVFKRACYDLGLQFYVDRAAFACLYVWLSQYFYDKPPSLIGMNY